MTLFHNTYSELAKKVDIKLSTFGFATYCDICFCNRVQGTNSYILDPDTLLKIKYGDKIFLNWGQKDFYLPQLLEYLKFKNLKVFFLILHEPNLSYQDYLMLFPYTLHILTTNNWLESPIVHNLPIGIRDGEEVYSCHYGFTQKTLLNYISKNTATNRLNKNILCLLCFTTYNWCAQDRNLCYETLHNKSFISNLNIQTFDKSNPNPCCGKVPLDYNYEKTLQAHFILSPTGAGESTHRFFEAIMLGSIPIVKKTNTAFDKLYKVFPCLVVDDWNQVTEEFLLSKKDQCYSYLDEFNKKYPNYYNDIELLFYLTIFYL